MMSMLIWLRSVQFIWKLKLNVVIMIAFALTLTMMTSIVEVFCNDDKFMMFEILAFAKTNIIVADSLWTQINGFLLSLNLGGRRRWYSVYQN